VAQEPPLQEPQPPELLPATKRLPPPSRLTAAKTETNRRASADAQRGQGMGASDWLIGRSASKRCAQ